MTERQNTHPVKRLQEALNLAKHELRRHAQMRHSENKHNGQPWDGACQTLACQSVRDALLQIERIEFGGQES